MSMLNRFKAAAIVASVCAVPALTNGCGASDAITQIQEAACCDEFKPGATVDAKFSANAQVVVAAQAIADFSGIAAASVDDITSACRTMAQELDAPADAQQRAASEGDKRKALTLWCEAAVSAIGTFKAKLGASATIDVGFEPPKCEASVSAKANCQAKCSVDGKCDIKANPPKCTGGKLEVACKGECKASANATLTCEGKCNAECKGSCTAKGGVQCKGKCDGTCKGAAQGGTGAGIQANGTCDGTCEGTCEVTAPGVTCEGSCTGECSGSCTGSAEASVKCDGECTGDFEPLKCTGGKLEGGCSVDAKCDANCDASVSAKAECMPPAVNVNITGVADANLAIASKFKAVLDANLGVIAALKARLEGMAKLTGTVTGSASAEILVDAKPACILSLAAAAAGAVEDVASSVAAAGSVTASFSTK